MFHQQMMYMRLFHREWSSLNSSICVVEYEKGSVAKFTVFQCMQKLWTNERSYEFRFFSSLYNIMSNLSKEPFTNFVEWTEAEIRQCKDKRSIKYGTPSPLTFYVKYWVYGNTRNYKMASLGNLTFIAFSTWRNCNWR